ncbi:FAD:protein FMN transferase [Glaciecola sp. SC05]|uniref:FAD:protein FMN transferase n=1 Tax=Glaciecola sp. SC05 TaxID=1987355 RepID=UPI003527D862
MIETKPTLNFEDGHLCGRFSAMASPCEILFDSTDKTRIEPYFLKAIAETKRIEAKYSRYIRGNLLHRINHSLGKPVLIDDETYQLLSFANTCYDISHGMFDITSGILRQMWRFDGSDNVPSVKAVGKLLPYIGWQRVIYSESQIILPSGFELDLGGIGKEYAVNKTAQLLNESLSDISVLVNFGGDIQVTRPRQDAPFWRIGIDNPTKQNGTAVVNIAKGGLATSGDANRYLKKGTKRYSHILNPVTGFPIENAARSITVASEQCIQAGLLATLAILQGDKAEAFLKQQGLTYWCYR